MTKDVNGLPAALDALPAEARARLKQKLKNKRLSGHSLIAHSLQRLGVTHVYGISGTPVYETHAACASSGMRVIGVRHQQAGAMMAAAQNYLAGRLCAVAILSAGPAITNVVTSVLVARDNGWPLLVLGGRRPMNMQGMGCFQELDAVPIFRSLTKFSGTIESTAKIAESLEHAVHVASSGRPGPVYLDLPEEILKGVAIPTDGYTRPLPEMPAVDAAAINRVALMLNQAQRPAVIIGETVRWAEPFVELDQLVNRLDAPFITSAMGQGYLPDNHPLCYNFARSQLLSTADVVLVIGARLDWRFRFGAEIARNAKLIQVHAHEPEYADNISSAISITGDLNSVLQQLLRVLADEKNETNPERRLWRGTLDKTRADRQAQLEQMAEKNVHPMTVQRLVKEIRDVISYDTICVIDGNLILAAAQQLLPSYLPVSRLTPGNNGCMGVGIPFGIGAKFARPERPVVIICGDTAFGFNVMEMETAVRLRIPVIIIIANNDGNGGARNQRAFYPEDYPDRVTMFQPGLRYEQIMQTFGGYGEFVEHQEHLRNAFERAVASGLPACINVRVNID